METNFKSKKSKIKNFISKDFKNSWIPTKLFSSSKRTDINSSIPAPEFSLFTTIHFFKNSIQTICWFYKIDTLSCRNQNIYLQLKYARASLFVPLVFCLYIFNKSTSTHYYKVRIISRQDKRPIERVYCRLPDKSVTTETRNDHNLKVLLSIT